MAEINSTDRSAFDGDLETPNRVVVVSTAEWETVLDAKVPNTRTRVRIWLNHEQWPDKVTIGLNKKTARIAPRRFFRAPEL